jgi:hypothetical protein
MVERPQLGVNVLLNWLRRRPAVVIVALVGTMAAAAVVVALALGLAKGRDSGPLHKEGNPFKERQMPGGTKQPQAGGGKAR